MEMKNTYLMPFYPNDDVRYNISYYYIGLKNKIKYTSKPTKRFYNKYIGTGVPLQALHCKHIRSVVCVKLQSQHVRYRMMVFLSREKTCLPGTRVADELLIAPDERL